MLTEITLINFLSFGPETNLKLGPLTVLTGPNGSGKSNLVEAFEVLRAAPRDIKDPLRKGGGIRGYIWHGAAEPLATIGVIFGTGRLRKAIQDHPTEYRVRFECDGGTFNLSHEMIQNQSGIYYENVDGNASIESTGSSRKIDIDPRQSILSQVRNPEAYPIVSAVGDHLKEILIYRSWNVGLDSQIRWSCRADQPGHILLEDLSNLPTRLAVLKRDPETKRRLLRLLSELGPFTDIEVVPEGGRLQLYLVEGDRSVPSHRLSEGTLRYLALLAILLDPGPAKLVILEGPDAGLHADIIPVIRDLLVEASSRFQLIITPASTLLIDALMEDHLDSVVLCKKCKKSGSTSILHRGEESP